MAGMGFELRKIYGRKTLAAQIWGTLYATMTTIGPAVLSSLLIILLKITMEQSGLTADESFFFISSTTYAFIIAMFISALLNTVVSRYISDCIFLKDDSNICASLFGVLTISTILSGVVMIALCVGMYMLHDGVSEIFMINYYFLGVLVTNTYCVMTYASALKRYKELTLGFFCGFLIALAVFYGLSSWSAIDRVAAACIALTCCYFFIVVALVAVCVATFGFSSRKYFSFLPYFKKFPALIVSGIAYTAGLFCPTMLYWFASPLAERISVFSTIPSFDLCLFLAIVVNMPALVIFVVKVETAFYETFSSYISALNNGSYALIERERTTMTRELRRQLMFVYEVQAVIMIVLVCCTLIMSPALSIDPQMVQWFVMLSIGVYVVMCMYFTIVVFYYFSDYRGACISSLVFLGVTAACALVAIALNQFYALPLLFGGLVGWGVSFTLLRRRMEALNSFLMTRS